MFSFRNICFLLVLLITIYGLFVWFCFNEGRGQFPDFCAKARWRDHHIRRGGVEHHRQHQGHDQGQRGDHGQASALDLQGHADRGRRAHAVLLQHPAGV